MWPFRKTKTQHMVDALEMRADNVSVALTELRTNVLELGRRVLALERAATEPVPEPVRAFPKGTKRPKPDLRHEGPNGTTRPPKRKKPAPKAKA